MIPNRVALMATMLLAGLAIDVGSVSVAGDRTALPTLKQWQEGDKRDYIVMIRGVAWRIPDACLPRRDLGADAGARDLGADAGERDLGADAGTRDLGADAGARDLGADAGARDLGADAGARDLGADAGARDLGADAGKRDLGADAEARDLGADAGARDLGADAGARDLGADAGERDLGADAGNLLCRVGDREESVLLRGVSISDIEIPEGSRFQRKARGRGRDDVRLHF